MILITYKTHNIGGLFIGTLFIGLNINYIFTHFNIFTILILLILYIYSLYIGSLFPDIDHPKSYLDRRYPLLSNLINNKFHHRGFTHSLLFIYLLIFIFLLVSIFLKIFYPRVYIILGIYIFTIECGFILGCLSHIIFDMFNPSGVCLFYPYIKKYRLPLAPTIKLNSTCEKNLYTFLSFSTYILYIMYISWILKFTVIN
ncbi:metal-dependent hydrolase [Paraclostridium sordellii]|uniref:metal-dependent hydrolase n=1 Tax=Paraclostridium sordellii TaxID=1505 RepID=UPI00097F800E